MEMIGIGGMKKRPDGNSVDLIIMKEPRVLFESPNGFGHKLWPPLLRTRARARTKQTRI